ncbi:MAG: hypothetical protein KIC46_00595, partial [Clostridiales bacterium]|nr:hypothetical protein [Clostridiales bacterium]
AVRRTFPNSTPHGVSNTWKGSFLPLPCAAGAKIPSRATQKDSAGAASASRKRPAAHKDAGSENDQKPCFFVQFFLLLDLIDKLERGMLYQHAPFDGIGCVFRLCV